MRKQIDYSIKVNRAEWSDQSISGIANGVSFLIIIQDKICKLALEGNDERRVNETARLIWELLALYDGYFYQPIRVECDGIEGNIDKLYTAKLYRTSRIWIDCAVPLARNQRCIEEGILNRYESFRECGRDSQKMMKSLVNAFYYLKSTAYENINVEHSLSLFLNMCDGFVINIYKDGAIKDHIKKVYSYLNRDVFHSGLKIVGITDIDNLNYMLGEYRNEIDHYKYLENSISSYASRQGISITKITWYLTYFTELALRTAFLDSIGFEVDDEIKSFAANDIVSWQLSQNICGE